MITTKPVRVALYIRVSTAEQLRGFGVEMQENALLNYVTLRQTDGWRIPTNGTFIEQKTGATQDRPVLQRLLSCVRSGQFDVVLVWKLDRISRSLSDLMQIQSVLASHGANLASMKEMLDFTTHTGRLMFHILGALAEFERDTIRMRTEEGKRTSALVGNYVGGQVPFGYQKIKNADGKGSRLQLVKQEAEVVQQIFRWYVREDLSYTDITRRLNRLGIKKGKAATSRQRHRPWYDTSVRALLRNEIYQGTYIANRYISTKTAQIGERPRDEWIVSQVEPVVSTLLFAQAQRKHDRVSERYRGGGRTTYMLSRKLVDPITARPFVGYLSGKGTKNYRRKKHTAPSGTTYRSMSVAARGVEGFVWSQIVKALDSPEDFIIEHRKRSKRLARRKGLEEKLALLTNTACEARQRCDLVERDFYSGRIDNCKRDELLAQYAPELEAALSEQAKVEAELRSLDNYTQACDDLRTAAARFKERLENLSYEEKAQVCSIFVDRVEVADRGDERVATAFLRFDPTSTTQATPAGRTEKPLPEGHKEKSEAKSSVGGGSNRIGYLNSNGTAFRFEVSQPLDSRTSYSVPKSIGVLT